jgi:phosphomevalonate kinase
MVLGEASVVPQPEAHAAYAQAYAALGMPRQEVGEVTVDVSSLRSSGAKLGLGSSAAAAAAAAGLAFAQHDQELISPAARDRVFDAAFRGHRDIAPQGSGADVAASVYGGFLRFRRVGDSAEVAPIAWPSGLRLRVVWTGQEARTSTFLARAAELAAARPTQYRRLMDGLASEAERFIASLAAADVPAVLRSTAAYGQAMGALGEAADIPVVNDTLRKVADMAEQAGGAAKPSGAGGGDVAIAIFPDELTEHRFDQLCRERNFALILMDVGASGVRLDSTPARG